MKRWMSGVVVLVAVVLTAPGLAQTQSKGAERPGDPVRVGPELPEDAADVYLGESMGVATNSKGHIFVYHRRDDTRLFEFDQNGTFVKEWGEGLYGFEFAHKVRVDKDDNVWVVDEGTNMVIKFNPEGRVADGAGPPARGGRRRRRDAAGRPAAGRAVSVRAPDRRRRGMRRATSSCPTGTSTTASSSTTRTAGSSARWAATCAAPSRISSTRRTALPIDAQGNVYVADRGNARIQVFDNNLVLRAIYDNVGNPWEVCISPGPHQYLFSSNSNPGREPGGVVGDQRRDLQDGARRADHRQVRARPARRSASSRPCTASTAATRTS